MRVFPASNTGRVKSLENTNDRRAFFEEISATVGTVTPPSGATIILDAWQEDIDAIVVIIPVSGQQPIMFVPRDSAGNRVTVTSFDTSGNYTLSGTPFDEVNGVEYTQWGIAYVCDISFSDFKNADRSKLLV